MKVLAQGENLELSSLDISNQFIINITSTVGNSGVISGAILLNNQQKITNENDLIFSQKTKISGLEKSNNSGEFRVNLSAIPSYANKIQFIASSDSDGLESTVIKITSKGKDLISFQPSNLNQETTVILGELYLHNEHWKFRALGQGFNNGLAGLAASYGISEDVIEKIAYPEKSNEHFDKEFEENAARIKKRLLKMLPQIKQAVKQGINEGTTRTLLDRFFTDVLGYKIQEMESEVKIQSRRADYVLSVGDKQVLIVEAKKAGLELKDKQTFQATSYAAYSGVPYVILTNLSTIFLYKVKTDGIVDPEMIFGVDFLDEFADDEINYLTYISRYGMSHQGLLDDFCQQVIATNSTNMARILLSDEIINKIGEIIKRDTNLDVKSNLIQATLETFMIVCGEIEI